MAKVVILGAGIGGLPAAFEMRGALPRANTITVVNASEQFQFVPSNPWVAVGWRTRDAISIPLAPILARKGIEFLARTVTRIDPATKKLSCSDGSEIPYDYLVIATGPKLAFDEFAGGGPGGHTHSICTAEHAELAGEGYRRFLADPGPVVIGAAAAASCFGPAYEFAFIMDSDLRKRRMRDRVPMTYVTSEPYIGHL